jgi:hypothetical protein
MIRCDDPSCVSKGNVKAYQLKSDIRVYRSHNVAARKTENPPTATFFDLYNRKNYGLLEYNFFERSLLPTHQKFNS